MAELNELQKKVLEYIKKHDALSREKTDILLKKISVKTNPGEVARIVKETFGSAGVKKELADDLMSSLIETVSVGAGVTIRGKEKVNSFKAWYTEYAYKPFGSDKKQKWSERINDLTRVKEITEDIRASIKAGQSMQQAAQILHDKGIQKADVAKDVQKIIDKARTLYSLSNDSDGYIAFKKEVAKVQKRINTLTRQDTSKLRRSYQNILDLTNKSSAAQVERAIKYTSYFKERYNAERIARTEMGRSYGDAVFSDAEYNDDVIGVKYMLSSGHSVTDQCDLVCNADMFGMGEGVYPKEHAPVFPMHPNCLCSIVKVFEGEVDKATAKDYNPNGGKKYLASLPVEKQKEILGISGQKAFKENPKSWEKVIEKKGYLGTEDKKATIPKKVLYGGK